MSLLSSHRGGGAVSDAVDSLDLEGLKSRLRTIEGGGIAAHLATPEVARLGAMIDRELPWGGLPAATLHEVSGPAALAVTAAIARRFLDRKGTLVWCRSDGMARLHGEFHRSGLRLYGIDPARLTVVRTRNAAEAVLAATLAMRSTAVACSVVEVEHLDLVTSRKLQQSVEMGGGACLVLRHSGLEMAPNAASTRFWAESLPHGEPEADDDGMSWRARRQGPAFRLSLWRAKGALPTFWAVRWNARSLSFEAAFPPAMQSRRAPMPAMPRPCEDHVGRQHLMA